MDDTGARMQRVTWSCGNRALRITVPRIESSSNTFSGPVSPSVILSDVSHSHTSSLLRAACVTVRVRSRDKLAALVNFEEFSLTRIDCGRSRFSATKRKNTHTHTRKSSSESVNVFPRPGISSLLTVLYYNVRATKLRSFEKCSTNLVTT